MEQLTRTLDKILSLIYLWLDVLICHVVFNKQVFNLKIQYSTCN